MDAQHKTIELRFGQRVRAFLFDGILRCDHNKWRVEPICFAVDGDSQLLHRFKQRGLRLRRGAVDFVGKNQIRENRATMKHQVAPTPRLVTLKNLCSSDVSGHQVGRELDATKLPTQQIGQRLHHHGFGQAGDADD